MRGGAGVLVGGYHFYSVPVPVYLGAVSPDSCPWEAVCFNAEVLAAHACPSAPNPMRLNAISYLIMSCPLPLQNWVSSMSSSSSFRS